MRKPAILLLFIAGCSASTRRAFEKVRERLLRATGALEKASISYTGACQPVADVDDSPVG
jgi:hypothetical protein